MASSDFDCIFILWAYDMYTSFFFALFSLVDAFKNEIGKFRLINSNHFKAEIITTSCHHTWEGLLADLALEFGKII